MTGTAATGAVATPHADGAAELRRAGTAVRTTLAPGGALTSVRIDEQEWCAAAGWTDHVPTIGACTLPTFVAGVAGHVLPAGGVLTAALPRVQVRADGTREAIISEWEAELYPLAFERTVTLEGDGTVHLAYRATNPRTAPVPFIWGMSIPCAWDPNLRIELPPGVRARVAASWGAGFPAAGSEFTWPHLRNGGELVDLARPAQLAKGFGVICFIELPAAGVTLRTARGAITVRGTRGVVSHLRVLVDHDAPVPGRAPSRWWRRSSVHRVLSVAPMVGAPDTLLDAVGAWKAARWVEPGATMQWDVQFARAIDPDEDG